MHSPLSKKVLSLLLAGALLSPLLPAQANESAARIMHRLLPRLKCLNRF
jgi:hypothetical protein